MWVVAGLLVGMLVVALGVGFHVGPHTHVAAVVIGVVACVWLALMLVHGRPLSLLIVFLGSAGIMTAGAAVLAWKGLSAAARDQPTLRARSLEGLEGVAVTELEPSGIVRVRGETWSASSANGFVPRGGRVQVIRADGVRLEVWGEEDDVLRPFPPPAGINRSDSEGES